MSEAIHRNTRGENPAVPVGIISRFPMLDPVERYISNFHVYCAIVLMVVLYVNFAGPKGNDPDPAKGAFHVWFGRVLSWLVARIRLSPARRRASRRQSWRWPRRVCACCQEKAVKSAVVCCTVKCRSLTDAVRWLPASSCASTVL